MVSWKVAAGLLKSTGQAAALTAPIPAKVQLSNGGSGKPAYV